MFTRILFPTDFSSYADSVLACLPDLMSAGLREVVLLSVIRKSDVPLPETVNRDSLEYWRWSLEEKLNIAKMALEGMGLRVLTRIEYGNSAEQIVNAAEDERVELIVPGAQGSTVAQELLIGSTAYEVIRRVREAIGGGTGASAPPHVLFYCEWRAGLARRLPGNVTGIWSARPDSRCVFPGCAHRGGIEPLEQSCGDGAR